MGFAERGQGQYEKYLLTVIHRCVRVQSENPGPRRGLAANSIICYCLRITEIDPVRMDMLVERFISRAMCYRPSLDLYKHQSRCGARCAGVSH